VGYFSSKTKKNKISLKDECYGLKKNFAPKIGENFDVFLQILQVCAKN
jgi:hypothetical protein